MSCILHFSTDHAHIHHICAYIHTCMHTHTYIQCIYMYTHKWMLIHYVYVQGQEQDLLVQAKRFNRCVYLYVYVILITLVCLNSRLTHMVSVELESLAAKHAESITKLVSFENTHICISNSNCCKKGPNAKVIPRMLGTHSMFLCGNFYNPALSPQLKLSPLLPGVLSSGPARLPLQYHKSLLGGVCRMYGDVSYTLLASICRRPTVVHTFKMPSSCCAQCSNLVRFKRLAPCLLISSFLYFDDRYILHVCKSSIIERTKYITRKAKVLEPMNKGFWMVSLGSCYNSSCGSNHDRSYPFWMTTAKI